MVGHRSGALSCFVGRLEAPRRASPSRRKRDPVTHRGSEEKKTSSSALPHAPRTARHLAATGLARPVAPPAVLVLLRLRFSALAALRPTPQHSSCAHGSTAHGSCCLPVPGGLSRDPSCPPHNSAQAPTFFTRPSRAWAQGSAQSQVLEPSTPARAQHPSSSLQHPWPARRQPRQGQSAAQRDQGR